METSVQKLSSISELSFSELEVKILFLTEEVRKNKNPSNELIFLRTVKKLVDRGYVYAELQQLSESDITLLSYAQCHMDGVIGVSTGISHRAFLLFTKTNLPALQGKD